MVKLFWVKKNVYKWYKFFQDGVEDANDEPRSGRPSTSTTDENVQAVKKIVLENRQITVREVAEDIGISLGSRYEIFSYVLGMRRVSAKFVQKLLNFDQQNRRMSIAQKLLTTIFNRTEICNDLRDKDCIIGRAQGYTEKFLWEVLWGLEKPLA